MRTPQPLAWHLNRALFRAIVLTGAAALVLILH